MPSFNVHPVHTDPMPSEGSNAKPGFAKVAEAPVVRKIPTLTEYDSESGLVEETGVPWKKTEVKTEKPAKKETVSTDKPKVGETAAEAKTRHQTWLDEQAAKKQNKEQARQAKQVEKQALARDYLQQGNIVKAAESLGVSVTELITLTQNAALSIPTPAKELTPAERKAKEDDDYRKSVDQRLAEADRFKYDTIANNWTRDNIVPVFNDKEKYPLLNMDGNDISKIQRGVYNYINEHYLETMQYDSKGEIIKVGETYKVEDVLDTMEAQLAESAEAALSRYRTVPKFSEYFKEQQAKDAKAARKVARQEEVAEEPSDEEPQLGAEDVDEEELQQLERQPSAYSSVRPRATSSKNKPFALLTQQEKVEYLRSHR